MAEQVNCLISVVEKILQKNSVSYTHLSQSFQDIMVNIGISQLQNKDSHFPEDEAGQSLNKYWFDKTLPVSYTHLLLCY